MSPRRKIAMFLALGCALGAVPSSAVAQATSPVALSFAGELCRAEAEGLVAAVEALGAPLGAEAVAEPGPPLIARVRVEVADGAGVTLSLDLARGGETLGRRRITGADCHEVVDAAALVVTLFASPPSAPSSSSPPPPPLSPAAPAANAATEVPPGELGAGPLFGALLTAPPPRAALALGPPPPRSAASRDHVEARRDGGPAPDAAPVSTPEPDRGPGADLRPSLGVSMVLAAGELPVATPGLEARFGIALGPLRLEAAGRYLFEQEVGLGQHPTGRVRFGLAAGSVGACVPFAFGAVTVGPCAGVEAGAIWGASTGVTDPGAATSPWVAPWATATATARVLPWLGLRGDVGLTVPLIATDFVVDGIGVVHHPAAATFRLGVGAEVNF